MASEWPETLDIRALLEWGWRPTPFNEFILKVHSRCNLSCDYCYIYEMADQRWRSQPRRMSRPIVRRAADRIAEHARANGLNRVSVTLHGGEPLLAGVDHLRFVLETVQKTTAPDLVVDFHVQTNGTLLSATFLDLFDEFNVRVGVSIDGGEAAHDLHRRRADGRGSYEDVRTGLRRMTEPRYRHLFSGLLCTIELRNDPVAVYESLLEFEPPSIDFLLPHGNWETPPPGRPLDETTPYGDWLVAAFDRWYGAAAAETRVRLFHEIIRLSFSRQLSGTESVGLSPATMVVVETNGQIEQVDSLKSVFDGASETPLHVLSDSFDTALILPSLAARQIGVRALADQCLSCGIRQVCGGGHYPHRYRSGTGFRNPSVYCRDLIRLITHINELVAKDVRALTD